MKWWCKNVNIPLGRSKEDCAGKLAAATMILPNSHQGVEKEGDNESVRPEVIATDNGDKRRRVEANSTSEDQLISKIVLALKSQTETTVTTADLEKKCRKCGWNRTATANFCGGCGSLLAAEECEATNLVRAVKCGHCQASLKADAKFCEHCGKSAGNDDGIEKKRREVH